VTHREAYYETAVASPMAAFGTILCSRKYSQIAGLTHCVARTGERHERGTNGGRTEAFQALRDSEELHRATLSSISDAVFLTDDAGLFTFVCPNVDVIFGYVPDEVRAMTRISGLLGENLFDRGELEAQGKKTTSGEVYDKNGLTAAHKKLPFGTKVKVTNVDNGKSVVVTVNDRMGASSPAIIDVTRRAANELDFTKAGKANVKVEVQK